MEHEKQWDPASLMMSLGYKPQWSEGAIKPPIFQTSTFVFKSAEEGKSFFSVAYGISKQDENVPLGLMYSRMNNPNLEILENRLSTLEGSEGSAVFESGMAAISSVFLEFLKPGDLLLHSNPVYGGTDHFINELLPKFGIESISFTPQDSLQQVSSWLEKHPKKNRLALIYLETPANPTNALVDIRAWRNFADQHQQQESPILIAVDNTYLGPLWQKPLQQGADFSLYSATKYLGGHSDLIAGACCANKPLIDRLRGLRTFLGNMASPYTSWLLLRSLETLHLRMKKQAENAIHIAKFLHKHPKVKQIHYLGLLKEGSAAMEIFRKQCSSPGAMISFEISGGEEEAFRLLNSLQLIKLAVSLGGTESLAEHPKTMTHAGMSPETQEKIGISDALIRLSVGVENSDDLIWDLENALSKV